MTFGFGYYAGEKNCAICLYCHLMLEERNYWEIATYVT